MTRKPHGGDRDVPWGAVLGEGSTECISPHHHTTMVCSTVYGYYIVHRIHRSILPSRRRPFGGMLSQGISPH
ncbi:hypothetical protein CTA1_7978 [Colletotrichum tanaceti]|uniref:Uncharacterized protein n=1 Tax=Colletotrichum tanaceti TaxID=1306861 RepID=A0A4U6WYG0_9PEZI|nr:hypothetical protein CTA1_7978 [Colletotrichum tanaceti]